MRKPTNFQLSVALATAFLVAGGDPAVAKKRFADGTVVQFTGNVIDPQGDPIADVEVQLEASRKSFSVSRFKRLLYSPRIVTARTDQFGTYTIDWPWHRYYNHFTISAVVPIPQPGESAKAEILTSVNVTDRVRRGSPIVTPLELESTELLMAMRELESSIDTNDERRVYREQGKPDRVATTDYPDHQAQAWWYFELGTVYRFVDGRLLEVETFDPVPKPGT